jgi:hypothetical protein
VTALLTCCCIALGTRGAVTCLGEPRLKPRWDDSTNRLADSSLTFKAYYERLRWTVGQMGNDPSKPQPESTVAAQPRQYHLLSATPERTRSWRTDLFRRRCAWRRRGQGRRAIEAAWDGMIAVFLRRDKRLHQSQQASAQQKSGGQPSDELGQRCARSLSPRDGRMPRKGAATA